MAAPLPDCPDDPHSMAPPQPDRRDDPHSMALPQRDHPDDPHSMAPPQPYHPEDGAAAPLPVRHRIPPISGGGPPPSLAWKQPGWQAIALPLRRRRCGRTRPRDSRVSTAAPGLHAAAPAEPLLHPKPAGAAGTTPAAPAARTAPKPGAAVLRTTPAAMPRHGHSRQQAHICPASQMAGLEGSAGLRRSGGSLRQPAGRGEQALPKQRRRRDQSLWPAPNNLPPPHSGAASRRPGPSSGWSGWFRCRRRKDSAARCLRSPALFAADGKAPAVALLPAAERRSFPADL
ncbi:hypothetical protein D3C73_830550 [compost metagenome]